MNTVNYLHSSARTVVGRKKTKQNVAVRGQGEARGRQGALAKHWSTTSVEKTSLQEDGLHVPSPSLLTF